MTLLTHNHVSLHRHVKASCATAFATATIVSFVYCALRPFASKAMGYPDTSPVVLAQAFAHTWMPIFIFGLAFSAIVFSLLRLALNRLGANLGVIYVGTGAILVAYVTALLGKGKDGFADYIGVWLGVGAGIGLSLGLFYWLTAARGRRQPVHPQQLAASTAHQASAKN